MSKDMDVKISEILKDLMDETDSFNQGLTQGTEKITFPSFVTSEINGEKGPVCNFSVEMLKKINNLTNYYFKFLKLEKVMGVEVFRSQIKQVFANQYFGKTLDPENIQRATQSFTDAIKLHIEMMTLPITHHFFCNTIFLEKYAPIIFGPITLQSRESWLNGVDFLESLKDYYANENELNHKWKDLVKSSAGNEYRKEYCQGLSKYIVESYRNFPAVLTISLTGMERRHSYKSARKLCQSFLDSLSLLFNNRDMFHMQLVEHSQRFPNMINEYYEQNGNLVIPSSKLGPHVFLSESERFYQYFISVPKYANAVSRIFESVIEGGSGNYPILSGKWLMALNWYASGCREINDDVAVSKMVSSLDTLSHGGKAPGITELLCKVIPELHKEFQITLEPEKRNLKQFVKWIYGRGRSQVLHGSIKYEELITFEEMRMLTEQITKIVLVEAALKLDSFTGEDSELGFRRGLISP